MPYRHQILLSTDPVPRRSFIFLSFCAHLTALALLFALHLATAVHFVPPQYAVVQVISGAEPPLAYNPPHTKGAQLPMTPTRARRSARRRVASNGTAATGAALQVLRQHASNATAGMIDNIKVSQFYGFHSDDYQLAFQTSGQLPVISAGEVPPRFEQLVTVEVTIDVDGHVADARIIGGEVSSSIQHKLLAAVREFRYSPAKHFGTPIPSQVDLIVHIPS